MEEGEQRQVLAAVQLRVGYGSEPGLCRGMGFEGQAARNYQCMGVSKGKRRIMDDS